jgi:ABC-type multidrug transport system ATPase subunit
LALTSRQDNAYEDIAGALKPTAGEALVLGAPAFDTAIKSRIGYLSETALLSEITLNHREVLSYFADIFWAFPQKQKKKE